MSVSGKDSFLVNDRLIFTPPFYGYCTTAGEDGQHKEVKRMQGYGVNIVVEGGELEKILARLSAAQEEIQQCYFELERLGVLVIKKPSEESDGSKDH